MKKSVVILIAIIYIVSIALVSFFGLQYLNFFEIVYTEDIELLDDAIKTNSAGEKYVVIYKDADGEYTYQIQYRVHPDNAKNRDVYFVYDEEKAEQLSITVSEDGLVKFTRKGTITVTIIAADGSGAKTMLKIYAK